jgi:hypothetical protein
MVIKKNCCSEAAVEYRAKPAWGKVRHPFARAESPTEHDAASKRSLVLEGPSMHFAASFLRIGLE